MARPEIKTYQNLEAAFAGESMAHIKYRYFARVARAAGDAEHLLDEHLQVVLVDVDRAEALGGALALLDERGDGAVITTIHSRTGTRMYVKRITAGRGESAIGDEEAAAVAAALALPRSTTER